MGRRTVAAAACLLASCAGVTVARAAEAQWKLTAGNVGNSFVDVLAQVRYAGCGLVAKVVRTAPDGTETILWDNSDGAMLETVDDQRDCECESMAGVFGTMDKTCPDEICAADFYCACTRVCQGIQDKCPPTGGMLRYRIENADGTVLAEAEYDLPQLLPGCKEEEPVEDDGGDASGGCGVTWTGSCRTPWLSAVFAAALLAALGTVRRTAPPRRPKGAADQRRSWGVWGVSFKNPPSLVVLLSVLSCCLSPSCRRGERGDAGKPKEEKVEPREPVVELEGSPWEAVINTQSRLMDLFPPEGEAGKVLWSVVKFRNKRLNPFRQQCEAARKFYAEDPEKRIGHATKAGSAWVTIEKHVRAVTRDWTPGEKREVEILLNQFACE